MLIESFKQALGKDMPSVIRNYLELENAIEIKQAQILNDLFDKMDQFNLQSINVYYEGFIVDGLMINPEQKQKQEILTEEQINVLLSDVVASAQQSQAEIKRAYYLKSLTTLVKKINYFTNEEQFLVNDLFEEMKLDGKTIENYEEERKFVIK